MKIQVLGLAAVGLVLGLFLWGGSGASEAPARLEDAGGVQPELPDAELRGLAAEGADRVSASKSADAEVRQSDVPEADELLPARQVSLVTGQVQDLDGRGVPRVRVHGSRVMLGNRGTGTIGGARTDSLGNFRIEAPEGMLLELRAIAPSSKGRRFGALPTALELESMQADWVQRDLVHARGGDAPAVLVIGPGGQIAGRLLLHPEYGNMGLSIRLLGEGPQRFATETRCDAQGRFLFDGLEDGFYAVQLVTGPSTLLAVHGVRAVMGELTRDPRLDGMQLDSLFVRTGLLVTDSEGRSIGSVELCVFTEQGEVLIRPTMHRDVGILTLPRGVPLRIWAHAPGYRPGQVRVLDSRKVRLQLERGIRAHLRVEQVREWTPQGLGLKLQLRRSSKLGGVPEFGVVRLDDSLAEGKELELRFPGPGRYELWAVAISSRVYFNDTRAGWQSGKSGLRELNLGQTVVIEDSDGGGHFVVDLPIDNPKGG